MPDAAGNLAGHGWSRKYEDAYTRIFGGAATQPVPREPPREVEQRVDCCYYGPPAEHPCDKRCPRWSPPDCNGCGRDGHVLDDCPDHPATLTSRQSNGEAG